MLGARGYGAEGAHKEIENILQRMREISVQAANDTNNDQDRANLQAEFDALRAEIKRIPFIDTIISRHDR